MNNRFHLISKKSNKMMTVTNIIVDKATGVQYLYVGSGYGGGLTVLVDHEGKPLLRKDSDYYD